jgi:hypothetical protein
MFIKTQNVRILTHTRTVTNYMLDLSSRQGGQPHNNNNNKTTTLLTTTRNRSRVSERLNAKTDWKTDHQLQTNSDSDNHFTLKIEAWRPSETLVFYRIITRCHNVQDLTCNVVVLISIHIWGGGGGKNIQIQNHRLHWCFSTFSSNLWEESLNIFLTGITVCLFFAHHLIIILQLLQSEPSDYG